MVGGAITSFGIGGGSASSLLTNLSGYWKYDELVATNDAIDATGNGLTLTQNNTPLSSTGIINTSRGDFATGGRFFNSTSSTFHTGSASFSLLIWAYANSTSQSSYPTIAGVFTTSGNNREWEVYWNDGSKSISFDTSADGATDTTVTSSVTITAGTWNMIVVVYDAGANLIKISVNDSAFDTASFTGPIHAGTANYTVGAREVNSDLWNGYVDESGFWLGRVLTTSDISRLWNGGAALSFASF